ncbi:hypothetical protein Hdeb2414_s0016g00498841 [Helianthus debilis subsp. tardiflorus]
MKESTDNNLYFVDLNYPEKTIRYSKCGKRKGCIGQLIKSCSNLWTNLWICTKGYN